VGFDTILLGAYDYRDEPWGQERVMAGCANLKKNAASCTCTYVSCEKHGLCCACVAYHRESGELPGCFFPAAAEKTYDRTARHYVRLMKDGE
jgi:hypothetical protein